MRLGPVTGIVGFLLFAPGTANAQEAEARYVVKFRDVEHGKAALKKLGGRLALELPRHKAVAAFLKSGAAEGLSRHPSVERVELDAMRYLQAGTEVTPYGISMVASDALRASLAGANGERVVCVIDSGLAIDHPDIQDSGVTGEAWEGEDRWTDDPANWTRDRCSHGTHVVGTIAALANDLGVVGVLGGGVRLHVVKVFDDACLGIPSSVVADAVERCKKAGAQVVNMSLGGSTPVLTEQEVFDQAYADGILLVAAAGNQGSTALRYPASYPSVISVAAVDAAKTVASFSQRNDEVELAAPGVNVNSTYTKLVEYGVYVDGQALDSHSVLRTATTAPGGVTAPLVDGGKCNTFANWTDRIVLCKRGPSAKWTADEALRVARRNGAAGVLLSNSAIGPWYAAAAETYPFPAFTIGFAEGDALRKYSLGRPVTLMNCTIYEWYGYRELSGTSMAAPHVTGGAALLWSLNPNLSNAELRQALQMTAHHPLDQMRDPLYGFGIVDGDRAWARLEGPANAPVAAFTADCEGLRCAFADASTDEDGRILAWSWTIDGQTFSADRNPVHTFAEGGAYTVALTVTDDQAMRGTRVVAIRVEGPPEPVLILHVPRVETKGVNTKVTLTWDGVTSGVDVYRNGIRGAANVLGSSWSEMSKEKGTFVYQVCASGTSNCSNEQTVTR